VSSFVAAEDDIKHTKDSIKTIKKNIKAKKAILVDVREKREWDQGHLAAAQFMPLSKLAKEIEKKKLPKDKIIYCHCRSGGRVILAAPIFKRYGYDIRPLKPGYKTLLKEGFAKARDDKKK